MDPLQLACQKPAAVAHATVRPSAVWGTMCHIVQSVSRNSAAAGTPNGIHLPTWCSTRKFWVNPCMSTHGRGHRAITPQMVSELPALAEFVMCIVQPAAVSAGMLGEVAQTGHIRSARPACCPAATGSAGGATTSNNQPNSDAPNGDVWFSRPWHSWRTRRGHSVHPMMQACQQQPAASNIQAMYGSPHSCAHAPDVGQAIAAAAPR